MKLLIKYPTRNRPRRFFQGMNSIYNNLVSVDNVKVLVTADVDDVSMNNDEVREKLGEYPNSQIIYGESQSKIDAVNRDMDKAGDDWHILLVMSDDMRFTFYGFDELLRIEFREAGLDTFLHLPDTDAKHLLATMYIAGRPFFERFGYIYHPSYKSLFCDNEVMEVAQRLGKYRYVNCPGVIFHEHPSYQHTEFDAQYQQQQAFWAEDEANYHQRKALNFPR